MDLLMLSNLMMLLAFALIVVDLGILIMGALNEKAFKWQIFFFGLIIAFGTIGAAATVEIAENTLISTGTLLAECMMALVFPMSIFYFIRYVIGSSPHATASAAVQTILAVFFICIILGGGLFPDGPTTGLPALLWAYGIYNVASLLDAAFLLFLYYKKADYHREKRVAIISAVSVLGTTLCVLRLVLPVFYLIIPFAAMGSFLLLYLFTGRFSNKTVSILNASRYLYEAVESPFLFVTRELKVMHFNNAALTFFNKEAFYLSGTDIRALFRMDGTEGYTGVFPKKGDTTTREASFDTLTAESGIPCQVKITQVYDKYSEFVCAILFIHDMSDKVKLINALEEEKEHAVLASRAKTAFLAKTSHEIRTPMNAIIGMSELALMEADITPGVRDRVLEIRSAGSNLLSIINDILDISKIESGKMEIVETNYLLSSMVNDIINIIANRMTDTPVIFTVNVDGAIPNALFGDEVRIRQVIMNILTNAVKYTREGHVALHITHDRPAPYKVILTVSVTDTGIGIRDEDKDKLFKEFIQLDAVKNHSIEGTGLGLSIAGRLCSAMGGSIEVESEYGKGSTFTLHLPQIVVEGETAPYAEVKSPETHNILIYETREAYAKSLAESFDNLGVRRKTVGYLSAFMEEAASGQYTYTFVPLFLLTGLKDQLDRLGGKTELVVITEQGDTLDSSCRCRSVAYPVHSMPIANILGNEAARQESTAGGYAMFSAPEARVLIVDDVATNLKVAAGLMRPFALVADTCLSGLEALEMAHDIHYDIIFMDHMMPVMDGIETTQKLRARGYDRPIIALTANAVSGVKQMFLENGMDDFLAKPLEISKLAAMLEKWIPKEKQKPAIKHETLSPAELGSIEIEGIDTRRGILSAGGDLPAYIEILTIFCRDGREKAVQLGQCLEAGDWRLYGIYVHAVKGTSATIGADELGARAFELEKAAKEGDGEFITSHHARFTEKLLHTIETITAAMPESESIEATPEDAKRFTELMKQLRKALEETDMSTVDELMRELEDGEWGAENVELISQVGQHVLMFDYEEAAAAIARGQLPN